MAIENSTTKRSFLEFLPVSLFGGVMGLTGLCFSWRLAYKLWQVPPQIGEGIGVIAILSFLLLTITYIFKLLRFGNIVRTEFDHPVSVSFFATFIISLLLLPGIIKPYYPFFAFAIWLLGAILMFFFALHVIRKWLDNQQQPENAMPAWILPVVGTLDVPIVGSSFDFHGAREICFIFFAIGIIFTIILLPVIFSRLTFQAQLPVALQPTMLILTGPFALAFSAYSNLHGSQDLVSTIFFYFNIFLLFILGSKIAHIPKACPFRATWWSVSFPLVAITISVFRYHDHRPDIPHTVFAALMLVGSTIVIGYLLCQTLYRIVTDSFDS
ncbi:SLAC1 anion channel family protein [Mucilaginibacter gynuensis]|uniref:SLAC1 anion channel family protein n=1 Tax=Mucilaginibacter gynuensis TaxID=1302236 RepID=UPI0031E7ED5F